MAQHITNNIYSEGIRVVHIGEKWWVLHPVKDNLSYSTESEAKQAAASLEVELNNA
jgi:hypothetical protein